ncbi:hypothetical protein [Brachybacterium massiliense]|uniref:hypothetical protein n=1 Tax=Brachybacterium massiliense TaxID=1755098 RepID=UPI000B3BB214|nr:hypothetical protein [Brachybacterium massiliense]
MEEGVGSCLGEIQALTEIYEEHPTAVEATLLAAGLRWRDLEDPVSTGTDWGDVAAVLEHAPWDAPIRRAVNPKDWPWNDPARDLLAGIVDELRTLQALIGNLSGAKPHQFPEPIKRPVTAGGEHAGAIETGEATLEEIDRILGW